jgi:aspartate/methionine/tyrosine aminotransferase
MFMIVTGVWWVTAFVVALVLAGFASYIWDTMRGRAKPNRVSWVMWTAGPAVAFGGEIAQHAGPRTLAVTAALGAGPAGVVVASLRNPEAYWRVSRFDIAWGAVSAAALVTGLVVTGNWLVAVWVAVAADACAAAPTIAKAWESPETETVGTYLCSGTGSAITLAWLPRWSQAAAAFPAYVVVVCAVIAAPIVLDRLRRSRPGPAESPMTRWERASGYERGSYLDMAPGYPTLSPPWAELPQAAGPELVTRYFAGLLGTDRVMLAPSCSMAITVAASALLERGGEVVLPEVSYDAYEPVIRRFGGAVRRVARNASGRIEVAAVAARCTRKTVAVWVTVPGNPLGFVYPPEWFEALLALCHRRNITLVVDYALAELVPPGLPVPVIASLAASEGVSWLALGDTGKLMAGPKAGAIAYSPGWRERLEAAASPYWLRLPGHDLHVLGTIVSDPRWRDYITGLNRQITANWRYLATHLDHGLRTRLFEAGCFALVDVTGLGVSDTAFSELLLDKYAALVMPGTLLGLPGVVRVALARSSEEIGAVAVALNQAAVFCGQLAQPVPAGWRVPRRVQAVTQAAVVLAAAAIIAAGVMPGQAVAPAGVAVTSPMIRPAWSWPAVLPWSPSRRPLVIPPQPPAGRCSRGWRGAAAPRCQ